MDQLEKILELWKDGINGPTQIVFFIISLLLTIYPLLNKLYTIKSYNEFDRLLISKNEKSIQQKIVTIIDYFLFCFLYFLPGFFLSIIISHINNSIIGLLFINLFQWIFLLTFIPIILKVIFLQILGEKTTKKINLFKKIFHIRFIRYFFNLNVYMSFIVYASLLETFLFKSIGKAQSGIIFLLFFPMLLLYLYRTFHKRIDYKYICKIISEKEFNDSILIVNYSLDKERIIFTKATELESSEIFMFDRSSGKYFKFTRVNVI
ncbi:hypothetical protein [Neobacillus sp. PS2-9]|uniref:hypothetical protein n=1 Tax=Neobacillus sp. PS2-9 TaxID=3070676 RepID=UPI0027E19901|nr:hypothetical protein [Neobacillus sp. PS2-9]WML57443.1 hypothetical protein RCG25_21455 [Neobacillus sp. PS2-9]